MLIPDWFSILAAFLFGAATGSFLNVCIYRIPRHGMSIASPRRSHCPSCGSNIPWYDNIPILSWLFLGGSCRSCTAPISPRYLLVEGLTAMAFSLLAYRYLLSMDSEPGTFVAVLVLTGACIVIAWIDQDLQIIPDEITLPGMMALPFLSLLVPGLHLPAKRPITDLLASISQPFTQASEVLPAVLGTPVSTAILILLAATVTSLGGLWGYRLYWRIAHRETKPLRDCLLAFFLGASAGGGLAAMLLRPEWILHPRIHSLWAALCGMATGAGLILLIGSLGRQVFRKEAMGFGDVKLMGLLGGFAGWSGILAGFAIACILGSVVGVYRLIRYRSRYLPFGPYLVIGGLAMVVWPEAFYKVLDWYMGLFR